MQIVNIDPFSGAAVKLTLMRDDLELAVGSGVLWRYGDGKKCVATAWHCLTGTHPTTKQSLSSNGARPNQVKVLLRNDNTGKTISAIMSLYDESDQPNWLVHQLGSSAIDLAVFVIPLDFTDQIIAVPANDLDQVDFDIKVGSELFIVSYPKGIERKGLPIWKRASLALDDEALFDEDDCRFYIVDSASRQGMSGGLVLARVSNSFTKNGAATLSPGPHNKIFGIYTGRLSDQDALDAQLGIVWPIQYVDEIINNGKRDDFS